MTGAEQHDAPRRRPVAIWHRPDGPARATALTEPVSVLPRAALARLIARRVLGDPDARVVIDHVVTLPSDNPVLPADQAPLDLDDQVPPEAGEPIPEVADPGTGTVRVLSRRCASCIYRPAMRAVLGLSVPALIHEARRTGGFVICHETLPGWQQGNGARIPPAICHGYAAQFPDTFALRLARAIGRIEPIDPLPAAGHEPEQSL